MSDATEPTEPSDANRPTGPVPGRQTRPVEDGATEASRAERIAGILVQVHEDVRMGHAHDEAALLRQRLDEAGVPVSDEELERYLDR